MRSMLGAVAVLTVAAIVGCESSTGIASCDLITTTAAFRDEISMSATVTSIKTTGQSTLVEAATTGMPAGTITFVVAGSTAVFERTGEGSPRASSACRLAVGEVVEIPLGDGFGDYSNPPPPPTVDQLVIDR